MLVIPDPGARTDVPGVERGTQVALVGLAPVYAHGLRLGLVSAGLPCLVLHSAAELPALLRPTGAWSRCCPSTRGPPCRP